MEKPLMYQPIWANHSQLSKSMKTFSLNLHLKVNRLLVQLVKQHGDRNWACIAEKFPLRAGKQCRDRWLNYLRPNIMKNAWSEEDDKLLIELHKQFGNKWAYIARMFPERSENSIKNHWNATKRRQLSMNNNKNIKYPSLLKDYITSLTSSSSDDQINIQQEPPVADTTTAPLEQPESSVFDSIHHQSETSFWSDSVIGYKPEMVFDQNDFEFDLVDQLQFDPNAEREFLDMFCW
ncbi:transcription factor MYB64-like [Cynara cardunculus var. scolymus]|uniref:Homeodomain-like protein n=1 Tax=Cynara cardunculus var. scolymus TaxID=59895 RepID=A0A103Y4W0_CYNCS|nr:transcription factor MYB64-like [Cynara cardunculus var. scolymus]KVI02554.1 Homeodomain-like protein [Cynara cardunculus var. scolymus]